MFLRMNGHLSLQPFLGSRLAYALLDLVSWSLAGYGAFLLRYDGLPPGPGRETALAVSLLVGLKLAASLAFRLHGRSWIRFAFPDVRQLAFSMAMATAAAIAVASLGVSNLELPVGVALVDGLLATLLMMTTRGLVRSADERRRRTFVAGQKRRNVLVIGAGQAGSMLVREMQRHPEAGMRPVGFMDDDTRKIGHTIGDVPVLGSMTHLADAIRHAAVDEVLIAVPSADGSVIRSIVERIRAADPRLPYRTMPALHELISGNVTVSRVRDVGIDDLLRRPPVKLDNDSILGQVQGKVVMVTGAGGSIGSELVRQICRFSPKKLVLFGRGENSIYQLERELDRNWPRIRYTSVIGAVQNVVRLDQVFSRHRPDIVFHAAAHKQVPLMESNAEEAIFNNIIGSRNVVDMALRYDVTRFVNVSTDKAVRPTSVMGASKRFVELLVENASHQAKPGSVFVSVRFGNVLGSRGSAVPLFLQQIKDGGPVTITHPDMVRYFMTIPEATQLVLQAFALGRNGEIYILDMGEPVRVVDLVTDLIRLSGLEPGIDIAIEYTGVRPGEKLVEELMTEDERLARTFHDKIFIARPNSAQQDDFGATIERLVEAAMQADGAEIRRLLGITNAPAGRAPEESDGAQAEEPKRKSNASPTLN